jgi:NADH:ubiquinone oxidoreductase subunit 3 (subunit A)
MAERRALKTIHLLDTIWFIACVAYILVLSVRQAGVSWWIIFSFSGHSAVLIFLVVCLYLFAIYKSGSRSQYISQEHPLTTTGHYKGLYLAAPILGSLAGLLGAAGNDSIPGVSVPIAMGAFIGTVLMWVVLDPAVMVLETLIPSARKHRTARLAAARAERKRQEQEKKRLLDELLYKEQQARKEREKALEPYGKQLIELVAEAKDDFSKARNQAAAIGLKAWQMGGLECMRQLYDICMEHSKNAVNQSLAADYISSWWDGIGSWRQSSPA